MMLAQRLYEAGYITYMRTDSTNISGDAIAAVRGLIEKDFGGEYLPEKPNFFGKRDNAQEAHEAIRPSDVRTSPESLSKVEADQVRLYDLIRRRFIACQMPPAKFDNTTMTITAGAHQLRATGRVLLFDGYQRVFGSDSKDRILPAVTVGEVLTSRRYRLHVILRSHQRAIMKRAWCVSSKSAASVVRRLTVRLLRRFKIAAMFVVIVVGYLRKKWAILSLNVWSNHFRIY